MKKGKSDAHSSELHLDTMCLVMPLRLGIFLVATATVLVSIFALLFRTWFLEHTRQFQGGYQFKTRVMLGTVETVGILFGMCGILGAWYNRRAYVLWFNVWQVIRILCWVVMYYWDVPLLQNCEQWINDVDGQIAAHGWNDLMYDIAMAAQCPNERSQFWVWSILTFLFFLYLVWCTHRYVEEVEKLPKHLLKLPQEATSTAWYAHPTGERGTRGGGYLPARRSLPEHEPVKQDVPHYGAGNQTPLGAPINAPPSPHHGAHELL